MAFKFYCPNCGHSEYISGSMPRRCNECGYAEEATVASKWGDLTDAQKERLVAISRGEQVDICDDDYWHLVALGLIKWITVELENIDYVTPAGGALLAERDKSLTDALAQIANSEWCIYERNGASEYGKGVTDGHRAAAMIAREGLAAVAKECGE